MTDTSQALAPSLTVIIVSYNSGDVIARCLGQFLDQTRFPVYIVDNANNPAEREFLAQRYPRVQIISMASNRGYGGGANAALRKATSDYCLLLNPDLSATDADVLQLLAVAAAHPDAAIIAPSTTAQSDHESIVEKSWVLGAAMLFDMDAMGQLGYFDEKIFLYYEEKDLCYRALQAGYKVLLANHILLPHLKGKSTASNDVLTYLRQWHVAWSSAYYFCKHGLNRGKNSPYFMLARYLFKACTSRDRQKRLKYRARWHGMLAYLRGEAAYLADNTPQAMQAPAPAADRSKLAVAGRINGDS